MKKELDYICIPDENGGEAIGGNQDWLPQWDMYYGGCAAVTACDLCLYLAARGDNVARHAVPEPELSPMVMSRHPSRAEFIALSRVMKPYISPRNHGVDLLEIYVEGLSCYWQDVGYPGLQLEGLSGIVDLDQAQEFVRDQIDRGFPVPFLMLHHKDPALDNFEWHWFNLAGFKYLDSNCEKFNCRLCGEKFFVKVVTYGEAHWLDFRNLWNTGQIRRGGMIKIFSRSTD